MLTTEKYAVEIRKEVEMKILKNSLDMFLLIFKEEIILKRYLAQNNQYLLKGYIILTC